MHTEFIWLFSILAILGLFEFSAFFLGKKIQSCWKNDIVSINQVSVLNLGSKDLFYVLSWIILLSAVCSLNQFWGMNSFLPAIFVCLIAGLFLTPQKIQKFDWGRTFVSLCVALSVFGFLYLVLVLKGQWVVEGVNHDLILYVRGAEWALDSGTQVAANVPERTLSVGNGGDTCYLWIGYDCPLHRGGTYSLSALLNTFHGKVDPYSSYLTIVVLVPLVVASLRLNAARSCIKNKLTFHSIGNTIVLSVSAFLLIVSSGVLSSVINANIATSVAAVLLISATLVFLAPTSKSDSLLTSATLGALAGLGAHLYSEIMWVILGLSGLHALFAWGGRTDQQALFKLGQSALITFVLFICCGNLAIINAIAAFFTIKGAIEQGVEWQAYFLEQPMWKWLATPFSGYFAGKNDAYPMALGAVGTVLVCLSATFSRVRVRALATIALYASSILLVILTDYKYGVHKIIQFFSMLICVVGMVLYFQRNIVFSRGYKSTVAITLFAMVFFSMQVHSVYHFGKNMHAAFSRDWTYHNISKQDLLPLSVIMEDDTVLIDDATWPAYDTFSKANWLIHFLLLENARPVMGKYNTGFRGGYSTNDIWNTMSRNERIDWVIRARAGGQEPLFQYPVEYTSNDGSFSLIDLKTINHPAFFQGEGFWEREDNFSWTKGEFSFEVHTPVYSPLVRMEQIGVKVELDYFAPPAGGFVSVLVDGELFQTYDVNQKSILINVPIGPHQISILPSWVVSSPKSVGLSEDSRLLFAAVKKISAVFPTIVSSQNVEASYAQR